MRSKEQIKEQREFSRKVESRIAEMGLLHKFVAEKIGLSDSRLSQFLRGFRGMPPRVKGDLIKFLKIEEKI
ncbi:MAG: hypothetical protein AAB875_04950 [Patescibacteria group bacterium]